jgi:hypothetical protein
LKFNPVFGWALLEMPYAEHRAPGKRGLVFMRFAEFQSLPNRSHPKPADFLARESKEPSFRMVLVFDPEISSQAVS